jgi:hypothetical protein
MADPNAMNRRSLLKATTGKALGAILSRDGSAAESPRPSKPDLIRAENEKPGTEDWMLSHTRVAPGSKYRCPWVEGFCSKTSLRAGESLAVMVSTNPPSPFTIDVYRLGFYGGKGGRQVARLGPFQGAVQPDPEVGSERLRECRWEPATILPIPEDWTSGVYLGKLTAEKSGIQSYSGQAPGRLGLAGFRAVPDEAGQPSPAVLGQPGDDRAPRPQGLRSTIALANLSKAVVGPCAATGRGAGTMNHGEVTGWQAERRS